LLTRSIGQRGLKRLDTFAIPREGRKQQVVSTYQQCAPMVCGLSIPDWMWWLIQVAVRPPQHCNRQPPRCRSCSRMFSMLSPKARLCTQKSAARMRGLCPLRSKSAFPRLDAMGQYQSWQLQKIIDGKFVGNCLQAVQARSRHIGANGTDVSFALALVLNYQGNTPGAITDRVLLGWSDSVGDAFFFGGSVHAHDGARYRTNHLKRQYCSKHRIGAFQFSLR
jgi:hypothetical protein